MWVLHSHIHFTRSATCRSMRFSPRIIHGVVCQIPWCCRTQGFPCSLHHQGHGSVVNSLGSRSCSVRLLRTLRFLVKFFTVSHDSGLVKVSPQKIALHYTRFVFAIVLVVTSDAQWRKRCGSSLLDDDKTFQSNFNAVKFWRPVRTGKMSSLIFVCVGVRHRGETGFALNVYSSSCSRHFSCGHLLDPSCRLP